MKKSEIVSKLAKEYQINNKLASKIVSLVFDEIINLTVKSGRLEIRNFGCFKLKKRKGRFIKNPKTGIEVFVNSRYIIAFKPSQVLIRKINGKV